MGGGAGPTWSMGLEPSTEFLGTVYQNTQASYLAVLIDKQGTVILSF